jgi:hypothetical protein
MSVKNQVIKIPLHALSEVPAPDINDLIIFINCLFITI